RAPPTGQGRPGAAGLPGPALIAPARKREQPPSGQSRRRVWTVGKGIDSEGRTMRWFALVALAGRVGAAPARSASARALRVPKEASIVRGKGDLGKVTRGWKSAQTGKGKGSVWKVVADESAPSKSGFVLAQTAASPRAMFNLCVMDDSSHQDVEISVAFKAI